MSDVQKSFSVMDSGDLTDVQINNYSELAANEVYIIVNPIERKIYIWKGPQAPVRRKFISARAAQEIRNEYGMTFRIDSLDQGLEGQDFLTLMGATKEEVAAKASSSAEAQVPAASRPAPAPAASRPAPTPAAKPSPAPAASRPAPTPAASRPAPTPAAKPSPAPAASRPAPAPAVSRPVPAPTTIEAASTPLKEVEDKLAELSEPPGMIREIVIVANTVFSVYKEYVQLFGKEVTKLEEMSDLPSGVFPASEYITRLFVDDGKVTFIELFREAPMDERDEFVSEMKRSLRDLTKLGL